MAAWKLRGLDTEIDGDEIVTKDNFLRKFAPLHLLERRHEALEAMRKGLTLGGTLDVANIFYDKPLEFVNKFLFSKTTYTVESVVGIIAMDLEDDDSKYEEAVRLGREQFREEVLPETLRTLSEKTERFLSHFLFLNILFQIYCIN